MRPQPGSCRPRSAAGVAAPSRPDGRAGGNDCLDHLWLSCSPILPRKVGVHRSPRRTARAEHLDLAGERRGTRIEKKPALTIRVPIAVPEGVQLLDVTKVETSLFLNPSTQPELERKRSPLESRCEPDGR